MNIELEKYLEKHNFSVETIIRRLEAKYPGKEFLLRDSSNLDKMCQQLGIENPQSPNAIELTDEMILEAIKD